MYTCLIRLTFEPYFEEVQPVWDDDILFSKSTLKQVRSPGPLPLLGGFGHMTAHEQSAATCGWHS